MEMVRHHDELVHMYGSESLWDSLPCVLDHRTCGIGLHHTGFDRPEQANIVLRTYRDEVHAWPGIVIRPQAQELAVLLVPVNHTSGRSILYAITWSISRSSVSIARISP
ncbi:MAG TPA: hypothetical protein VFI91_00920, partial [Longimicrobiaceae bacterium]|nr:hypothetical protein [Longimicrobiaceae bacterium]